MEDGSTNGTIAYSDFEAYYGYYVPPFKPTVKNLLAGMSSANSRVAVTSDTIAVFSHPTNTAYQINSDDVVSALTPIEGWTLSYVNSNKTYNNIRFVDLPSTKIKGFEAVLHSFLATILHNYQICHHRLRLLFYNVLRYRLPSQDLSPHP